MDRGALVVALLTAIGAASLPGCGSDEAATGTGATSTGSGHHGTGGSSHHGPAGTGAAGQGGGGANGSGGSGSGGGPPACAADAWATYGHDAARTFAAPACIKGPLTTLWRYVPTPPAGETVGGVFSAIAEADGIYLKWKGHQGPYYGTPFVEKISAAGAFVWQFNSGVDSSFGQPLSVFGDFLVSQDDGMWFLGKDDGVASFFTGVDWWGQTAPTGDRLFVVQAWKVDGPGVFIGAYDLNQTRVWAQNEMTGNGQFAVTDSSGAVAVQGSTAFFAGNYSRSDGAPPQFPSGVYAFDAATGAVKWSQPTVPAGNVSAGGGQVYLPEGNPGSAELVARKQTDGSVAWKATIAGLSMQAPVVAGGKIIVGSTAAVTALDASTGAVAWTAPVPVQGFGFGQPPGPTNIAAALASGTVVVVSGTSVHVLDLETGAEQSTSTIEQVAGFALEPVLVQDRLYVIDQGGLIALGSAP